MIYSNWRDGVPFYTRNAVEHKVLKQKRKGSQCLDGNFKRWPFPSGVGVSWFKVTDFAQEDADSPLSIWPLGSCHHMLLQKRHKYHCNTRYIYSINRAVESQSGPRGISLHRAPESKQFSHWKNFCGPQTSDQWIQWIQASANKSQIWYWW